MANAKEQDISCEKKCFSSDGIDGEITFDDKCIEWKLTRKRKQKDTLTYTNYSVEWNNVFGVRLKLAEDASEKKQYLEINYIVQLNNKKLKHQSITFCGEFNDWKDELTTKSRAGKPKRLLTIINPVSGFGKGQQTYERKVAPLFELADIDVDVLVTKRAGHSVEALETYDLSSIDGIIAVGGDGIYHEILNGILPRVQKENGVDHNDVRCNPVSPSIPIGLIPTGTGNGVAQWCYGCKDIETAALHVIRGIHHKSSALSINVDGKHIVYGGLLFSYGIMSDIIKKAESRRWMKVIRYPVSVIGGMLGRQRCCRAELTYKTFIESENEEKNTEESDWHKAEIDRFLSISIFTGNMNLSGDEVHVQMTENTGSLFFYNQIGKMDHLKFWAKFASGSKDTFDFEWLHLKQKTTRFHIKVDQSTIHRDSNYNESDQDLELYINVDGESMRIKSPDIHVRYCGKLISLYSTKFY